MRLLRNFFCVLLLAPLAAPASALAQQYPPRPYEVTEQREPCRNYQPQKQVFWGDTHVHTTFSMDALLQETRNRPEDAYRYARGERLGLQPYDEQGKPLRSSKLRAPLDFAMVSDHAEWLGFVGVCTTPGYEGYSSFMCRAYRNYPHIVRYISSRLTIGSRYLAHRYPWLGFLRGLSEMDGDPPALCGENGADCIEAGADRWRQTREAAEDAYDRSSACRFTSFIGYEWTGNIDINLHRNVMFRNHNTLDSPIGFVKEPTPEGLWESLRRDCLDAGNGCDALAIPHNSNLSDGGMFPDWGAASGNYAPAQARLRARVEPLFEIMQHKGDSECWYGEGVEDELCAFEKLPYNRFTGSFFPRFAEPTEPGDGYARGILAQGMRYWRGIGVDPYQMGFIGSTDTHLGIPGAVEEDDHQAHGGAGKVDSRELPTGLPDDLEFGPGGLAAVWAEENTRDALFAAMQRRETYGTSGPRIRLRFFGGWNYDSNLCNQGLRALIDQGYQRGAPMGGELKPQTGGGRPGFVIDAWRAIGGGSWGTALQQVQVIKGWVDDEGRTHEKVYTAAGNPDNGASVDPATCRTRGPGYDRLCRVWEDPDFRRGQQAYYYARVLENPVCRWSARVCNANQVDCDRPETVTEGLEDCCAPDHRRVIQERAWSSPIWYRPAAARATQ